MSEITKEILKSGTLMPKSEFDEKNLKCLVLNSLIRHFSILDNNGQLLTRIPRYYIEKISRKFPSFKPSLIQSKIHNFFWEAACHIKIFQNSNFKWSHEPNKLLCRVRSHLHTIHRIAPVFGYKRARVNLESLHKLLKLTSFWPQLTTQVALVIYITDEKSKNKLKILQKNIRVLCNCSAYAFHRARNKLNLTKYI